MFSGLAFCLAFGLAAWLIWRASAGKGGPLGDGTLALGAALPAGLILVCMMLASGAGRLGEMRLTVSRIEAGLNLEAKVFRVGGDARSDDLLVPGLPGGLLTVVNPAFPSRAPGPLSLAQGEDAANGAPVLVGIGRKDRLVFAGEHAFGDGDAVCLSRCDGPGARWFVLDGRRFRAAILTGGRWKPDPRAPALPLMPTRKVMGFLTDVAYWTPAQAIHPLRDHLDPAAGAVGPGGCGTDYFCVAAGGARPAPALSFLARQGGLGRGDWRLVLLDPGARYAPRGDPGRAVAGRALAPLQPGDERALSIWEVRYAPNRASLDGDDLSRLVERRSFTLAHKGDRLEVRLDTPESAVIGGCTSGELTAAHVIGDPEVVEGAVKLNSLGGASAAAAAGPLPLPERNCGAFAKADRQFGDLAVQGRAIDYRLERMALPAPMIVIVLGWAIIAFMAHRRLWRTERGAWMLATGLQMLLALRWLIAFSGSMADIALDWRQIQASAGAAYVLCPVLLMLLSRPTGVLTDLWSTIAIFLGGALTSLAVWVDGFDKVSLGLIALVTFGLLAAIAQSLWPGRLAKAGEAVDAAAARLSAAAERRWKPWRLFLGLALAIRTVLGFAGAKERVGLAISAIYTPLLILGFSDLMDRAQRAEPRQRWGYWGAYVAAYGLLIVVLPGLVHDIGYSLVVAAPFAAFPAVLALTAPAGSQTLTSRLAWSAPFLAFVCGLVLLLAAGAFVKYGVSDHELEAAARADTNASAIALLQRQAERDQNFWRLAAIGLPEWLASAGTTEAENLRVWSANLSSYTSEPLGRGYLAPSRLSPVIRPVQMDDNLSAVHLMSPFGRAAAAALLILLASLPLSLGRLAKVTAQSRPDRRRIAGLLSLWLMFGVAAYVILANLQLTPFTGRNVYLLAAKSGSDLVEGFTLFALALWGLARAPGRA